MHLIYEDKLNVPLDTIFDMMKNLRKEKSKKIVEALVFIKPGYQLERVV